MYVDIILSVIFMINRVRQTDRTKRETEVNRQVARTCVTALALSKLSPHWAVEMFSDAEVMYSLITLHECRCLRETQSW